MELKYTGPVKELGFKGPATGQQYMAFGDLPFVVDDVDGAALLQRYGSVLEEVKPVRSSSKPGTKPPVEPAKGDEPDGEIGD